MAKKQSRLYKLTIFAIVILLFVVILIAVTPNPIIRADSTKQNQDPLPKDLSILAPPPDDPDIGDLGEDSPILPQPHREVDLAIEGGTWLAQGPGPALDGDVENIFNGPVAGAVHAIAAHPTSPNILYVGAANGGVWKTTNAFSSSPIWEPLTDQFDSLSIGALEFDPTDTTHNTLVAGSGRYSSYGVPSYGGPRIGLLRTTDGGTTWTEIDGGLAGKNISGVAARGNVIVATSNTDDNNECDAQGIFRSTNGGISFLQVGPKGPAFDLASDPTNNAVLYSGLIYVNLCTGGSWSNGIYKSIDTGATWTKISNSAMDALIVDSPTDENPTTNIEIDARESNVFVNIIQNGQPAGIFYSNNGGSTWTAMDLPRLPVGSTAVISDVVPGTPITIDTGAAHGLVTDKDGDGTHETAVEVQITNVTGTTVANGFHFITVIDDTKFSLNGSSDTSNYTGGGNWQKVVGMSPRQKPGSQGGKHASIRIDPNSGSTVYVGGDRQDPPFPNYIGALTYTGSLFRGDALVTASGNVPSPQWEHLTHSDSIVAIPGGGTSNGSAPHADSREMVFAAGGGTLIEGDDGGIYYRNNPQNNTGSWYSLNGNLQIAEIHDIAFDTLSNTIISGNQDIGTTYQPYGDGDTTWLSLSKADGGDVAVDNIELSGSNLSVRYSSFQNLGDFRRSVWDSSGNEISTTYPALSVTAGTTFTAQFVTPVVTNNAVGDWLLIGGANGLYESKDGGSTIEEIGPGLVVNTIGGHMIDYGNLAQAGAFYAVTGGNNVSVRTTWNDPIDTFSVALPDNPVRGVAMHPLDPLVGFAIDSDEVIMTSDGGNNWTNITGSGATGLSDNNLRSIETGLFSGVTLESWLFVGGGLGVYKMDIDNPGIWVQLGTGLPHAPVWDLDYDFQDKVLVAGTLGRGAWTLSLAALECNSPPLNFEFGIPFETRTIAGNNNAYWTLTSDDQGCSQGNQTGGSGNNAACSDSILTNLGGFDYNSAMISNGFDLSAYSATDDINLNFAAAFRQENNSNFGVFITTDGGSSWTNILNWDTDHYLPGEDVSLDLSSFAGQPNVQASFYHLGDNLDGWVQVDDIALECVCFAPAATDLSISYSGNDALLNWSDTGADVYEIHSPANDFYFTPNINTLFTITTGTNFTFPNDLGNPNFNYAYAIMGKSSCGAASAPSNRTGEFDFRIEPGTP